MYYIEFFSYQITKNTKNFVLYFIFKIINYQSVCKPNRCFNIHENNYL